MFIQNLDGTVSHRCNICGGCAHPATGCVYTENFIVCWRCTEELCAWIVRFTNGKGRKKGVAFYDCVISMVVRSAPTGGILEEPCQSTSTAATLRSSR